MSLQACSTFFVVDSNGSGNPSPKDLAKGTRYRFREWPNGDVPDVAAGVYAIGTSGEITYVKVTSNT